MKDSFELTQMARRVLHHEVEALKWERWSVERAKTDWERSVCRINADLHRALSASWAKDL